MTGKTIKIGDEVHHFSSMSSLQARIDEKCRMLAQIERERLARDPHDIAAWRDVEIQAAILTDLTLGMEEWLREQAILIEDEIAATRAALARMGLQIL